MLNAVLGDGMSSRLFLSVREELGLAYDVSSGLVDYADAGALEISAGVDPVRAAGGHRRDPRRARPPARRPGSGRRAGQGQALPRRRAGAADGRHAPRGVVDRRPGGAPRSGPQPRRGARRDRRGGRRGRPAPGPVACSSTTGCAWPPSRRLATCAASSRDCGCRHDASRRDPAGEWPHTPRRPADLALARVHLRLGSLALARAELEMLAGAGELDGPGRVDLAEARWRTGDLAGAGEAAMEALTVLGDEPVALVIAAEAAAALGRPSEARRLATRAMDGVGGPIDGIFAGMPRSAVWPADAAEPPPTAATLFQQDPIPAQARRAGDSDAVVASTLRAPAGEPSAARPVVADPGHARLLGRRRGRGPARTRAARSRRGARSGRAGARRRRASRRRHCGSRSPCGSPRRWPPRSSRRPRVRPGPGLRRRPWRRVPAGRARDRGTPGLRDGRLVRIAATAAEPGRTADARARPAVSDTIPRVQRTRTQGRHARQ